MQGFLLRYNATDADKVQYDNPDKLTFTIILLKGKAYCRWLDVGE